MQSDKGYISPYFVTDAERMACVLEDPYILIHEEKISAVADLVPLVEKIGKARRPAITEAAQASARGIGPSQDRDPSTLSAA